MNESNFHSSENLKKEKAAGDELPQTHAFCFARGNDYDCVKTH